MQRFFQAVLVASLLALSWLGMMLVHELGHLCSALVTGGVVQQVIFHPLCFSETQIDPNPSPLIVVWAGPTMGSLLPVALWLVAATARLSLTYFFAFFAGFCLIANGAYVGLGAFAHVADAGEMLRLGSPPWILWSFGILTGVAGFWLWHQVSPKFGFGAEPDTISSRVSFVALSIAISAIILAAAFGNRGI